MKGKKHSQYSDENVSGYSGLFERNNEEHDLELNWKFSTFLEQLVKTNSEMLQEVPRERAKKEWLQTDLSQESGILNPFKSQMWYAVEECAI